MLYYRPDETEDLTRCREEIERLENFIFNCAPAFVGTDVLGKAADRLTVLYGTVEPYQPFGPF